MRGSSSGWLGCLEMIQLYTDPVPAKSMTSQSTDPQRGHIGDGGCCR
jgi:hypothetical protein